MELPPADLGPTGSLTQTLSLLREVLASHDSSVVPLDARQADFAQVSSSATWLYYNYNILTIFECFCHCLVIPRLYLLTVLCFSPRCCLASWIPSYSCAPCQPVTWALPTWPAIWSTPCTSWRQRWLSLSSQTNVWRCSSSRCAQIINNRQHTGIEYLFKPLPDATYMKLKRAHGNTIGNNCSCYFCLYIHVILV